MNDADTLWCLHAHYVLRASKSNRTKANSYICIIYECKWLLLLDYYLQTSPSTSFCRACLLLYGLDKRNVYENILKPTAFTSHARSQRMSTLESWQQRNRTVHDVMCTRDRKHSARTILNYLSVDLTLAPTRPWPPMVTAECHTARR